MPRPGGRLINGQNTAAQLPPIIALLPLAATLDCIKMTATLYVFGHSVWSAAPELAVADLGFSDKVVKKTINLVEGKNFNPSFLKINANATLPTLTTEGTTLTNTADVVSYVVKNAPVKVAPGTSIIEDVHKQEVDPNFVLFAARNDAELSEKAKGFAKLFTENRVNALKTYAATPEAEGFKSFYDAKIAENSGLLALLNGEAPDANKQGFFHLSTGAWSAIQQFLYETLPAHLTSGPFLAGERPGEDDFHVGAWIARIAFVTGAQSSEQGVEKLQAFFGATVPAKVVTYWNAWSARDSWKETYAQGLH
ncbi:hypothetical protein FA95DRAFT_716931 [Auriscalpium vulgare]|uniref:Uncharacterized protein n=1 Tax=Auriscalpium vulgare TaxID=40419 RepID=A0ACB8SAR2_9AGAM|nr:hypothetical protein FA95DRAFT_716931 [Auriscalpium vulgare]